MDQKEDFADDRLLLGCLYCGGMGGTRDHVPSRIFLDRPYPEQLAVVDACYDCNNGFSGDEEYLASLIEATVAGTTDPESIRRPSVAKILRRSPSLRAKLDAARREKEGRTWYSAELDRVRNVLLKLARGHAAYELSLRCLDEPTHVAFGSIHTLAPEAREEFDSAHFPHLLPEIGSRATQRMMVVQAAISGSNGQVAIRPMLMQDWIDVQEDRYSYLATDDGAGVRVRLLVGGYLACDIRWTD
ncbi:MAG: hypothetical protein WDA16_13715 [Candidatus Thermoplasmatota archaeon]